MNEEVTGEAEEKQRQPGLFRRLFARVREGLAKTRRKLVKAVFRWLGRTVDQEVLDELEEALLATDMGPEMAEEIRARVDEAFTGRKLENPQQLGQFIGDYLKSRMPQRASEPLAAANGPTVVLVVGVNGTGKTTTIGKLAWKYAQEGKKVVIAAGDTFRAAAINQLRVWAERAGSEFVATHPGADAASVAFSAVEKALARDLDVVLIDTAGRLQNKENLMRELEKISRVLKKRLPQAPHECLLVLDATHGQDAVGQAREFTDTVGVTGIVLAKVDGTAKGGVVLRIHREIGLPIKYLGVGEKKEDLQRFDVEVFLAGLFDFSAEKMVDEVTGARVEEGLERLEEAAEAKRAAGKKAQPEAKATPPAKTEGTPSPPPRPGLIDRLLGRKKRS